MPTLSAAAQADMTTKKNEALNAIYNRVDAGSGPGTIKVYTGARPASPDDAATGTLLATFVLPKPAWAAAAAASKQLNADPDITVTVATSGTPGWARAADSAGVAVADFTVGTTAAEMITTTSPWVAGQTVNLTTGAVTL